MRVFLDTNVIIDLIIKREPFYYEIAEITTNAEKNELTLFTSSLSFVNTFYIASKVNTKESVLEILRKFRIICNVSVIDEFNIDKSLISDFSDFEDAVQYNSALHHNCDCIITRDKIGFKNSKINVMTPTEFLASQL
ncbi:type II toxin-antitoxin system VapC family toxin [Flavobacterium soli]|uniref:type II toxin-antitoxin system VapC family toxin n=1 Tax=Flavobacterium soli TaxID=344881 RepID=UPI000404A55B|nr:PIN domain-containing protein [Flavobacterium soli]